MPRSVRRASLTPALTSLSELRRIMAALPSDTSRRDLLRLARWAGHDEAAMELAARGCAALGLKAWIEAFASEPSAWASALGAAPLVARWRAEFGRLSDATRRWLTRLSLTPASFPITGLVADDPGVLPVCHRLADRGWVAGAPGARLEVPEVRAQLVRTWVGTGSAFRAAEDWLGRYVCHWLERYRSVTSDDRILLARWIEDPTWVVGLAPQALRAAVDALRHTTFVPLAIRALRQRLAHPEAQSAAHTTNLRRDLGCALVDIGAYGESLRVVRDPSRTSTIVRANAMMRRGDVAVGRAHLRRVDPDHRDRHWHFQWALAATLEGTSDAHDLVEAQLDTATDTRHRGLAWWLDARSAGLTGDLGRACASYARAIDDLTAAEDLVGVAWCRARWARALWNHHDRDRAREVAIEAWGEAQRIPGATVLGLAALACIETGVAPPDNLTVALRRAGCAELPDVVSEVRRHLVSHPSVPVLSIGGGRVRLDGDDVALAPGGPPWRILRFLSRRGPREHSDIEQLFAAGWPDERAGVDSRRRRVQTAIWTLRRAGLRRAIRTVQGNRYCLDACVIEDAKNDPPGRSH
ncbi:MAG: helix-turn-helix domain-containing protein [Myxococcota bacterium]